MGGLGSGRHAGTGRRTVEACRAIDIRALQRAGCLRRPGLHTLRWVRGDEQDFGAVGVQTRTDGVALLYRVKVDGDDWEDIRELVPIVRVGCHLGGARPFFLCPGVVNGVPCGRRVALLYLADRYFVCRSCARLAYRSQQEDAWDRARRRVDKLHWRLGIQPGDEHAVPSRPARMWKRTFATLLKKADEAQAQADAIFEDRSRHLMRPIHLRHRRRISGHDDEHDADPRAGRNAPTATTSPASTPSSTALSRHTVLPWENADEYASLLARLVAEHQPDGPTEEHLVEELAGVMWRKQRLRLAEVARPSPRTEGRGAVISADRRLGPGPHRRLRRPVVRGARSGGHVVGRGRVRDPRSGRG